MTTRVLSAVLALLMLMPAGVCTCEGGPRACPDHPAAGRTLDGRDSSCCRHDHPRETGSASEAAALAEHHCPAPLPHHSSCPAVAAAAPADARTATDASTLLAIVPLDPPVASWLRVPPRTTHNPALVVHVPSPPLFIAHCTLVI